MDVRGKLILLLPLLFFHCSLENETVANKIGERIYLIGDDFSAWRDDAGKWEIVGDVFLNPQNERLLSSKPGTGVIVNGPAGRTSHLLSKFEFGDIRTHIEFMVSKDSNSGVYFMGRYELQIFDSWQKKSKYPGIECGGIYQRWDENRRPKGFEGHSPRVNGSRPPGKWQSFDVVFRAPRFDSKGHKISNARFEKVVHNGVIVHEDVQLTGPTRASAYHDEKPLGPVMLQGDHGPVAYRNMWVEPAGALPFFAMDTGTKDARHHTAKQQVDMLKELGYDGIGVGFERGESLAEMLRELDKNGLRLFTVYTGVNIDPGQQRYGPRLTEALKILKGRNTILWILVRSKKYRKSCPHGDLRAVEIVREIADMAAPYKVRVALYPHYGFWLERVQDAVRVAKKVDRENVGVTFNLCHWLKVDDQKNMKSLMKLAMPLLFVVTINGADAGDTNKMGWDRLIQTLDSGSFDVSRFMKMLGECGYNGPIGLQGYGIGGDAYENLKRSIGAWRRLCGPAARERLDRVTGLSGKSRLKNRNS